MREKRILELKYEYEMSQKAKLIYKYELLSKEKELMKITTTNQKCIIDNNIYKRHRSFLS